MILLGSVPERGTLARMGLRELRQEHLLSIRELAERAGVSTRTVVGIEMGRLRPHPSTLRKLADALQVEPAALVEYLRRRPEGSEQA